MRHRLRVLTALLALLALSVTLVEPGWALGCEPVAAGPAGGHAGHAGEPAHHGESESPDSTDTSAPACRVGAPSGCAFVFLPTSLEAAAAAPSEKASVGAGPETTPDLLPPSLPLRPPRL